MKLKTQNSASALHNSLFTRLTVAATTLILASAVSSEAQNLVPSSVVFDNISNAENGVAGASITGTSSTPNTFMGGAYTLAAGTTDITGFDVFPVNFSSTTNITNLKINIFVWGTVNTGTVSAATPAFSNLLGSYSLTSAIPGFPASTYYNFEGTPPGSAPGIILGAPLVIPSTTIGVTMNYQGSTDGGVTYNSITSLTSLISYGTAATVGANVFNGYYRNAASEVNGNFVSTLRSLGLSNQSVALRVFGDVSPVPEPASFALMGLGSAALLIVRRRK